MAIILFSGCQSQRMVVSDAEKAAFETTNGDPVTIENEELEYEITIIDPGFYSWLYSIAHPRGYYSQSFLENRNRIMVMDGIKGLPNLSFMIPIYMKCKLIMNKE